jgi:hypothetical protein
MGILEEARLSVATAGQSTRFLAALGMTSLERLFLVAVLVSGREDGQDILQTLPNLAKVGGRVCGEG